MAEAAAPPHWSVVTQQGCDAPLDGAELISSGGGPLPSSDQSLQHCRERKNEKQRTASKREWSALSKRARGRRKEATQTLREQCSALAGQLDVLRTRRAARPSSFDVDQQARREAQYRNLQLQNCIKLAMRDAHKINRLLGAQSMNQFRVLHQGPTPTSRLVHEPMVDDQIFEALELDQGRQHREMEQRFQAVGLTQATNELSSAQIVERDDGRACIQVVHSQKTPFAPDVIAAGILQFTRQYAVVCNSCHSEIGDCLPKTTWLKTRYLLRDTASDQSVAIVTRGVLKVVEANNGLTIVWTARGTSEPEHSQAGLHGIVTQEEAWGSLQPCSLPGTPPVTLAQSCFRTTPILPDGSSTNTHTEMSKMILPCVEKLLEASRQGMENCFVDEMRRRVEGTKQPSV